MVREKTPASDFVLDIDGPKGNAFYLMKLAKDLQHYKGEKASALMAEMMGGDYHNLIKVFDENFGDMVILETRNKELLDVFGS